MDIEVLFEDNHLLAVNKPAALATMGLGPGETSLVVLAKEYIKKAYFKPGNVYLGVVHRLDSPATGVVLLARTSKAAARLTELFRDGRVQKRYLAVVRPAPTASAGICDDWLRKDDALRRVVVCALDDPEARQARLAYRVIQRTRSEALLEVDLQTGRKHQIRVQLSRLGCPVLGDVKYGGPAWTGPGIALHARTLEFVHPVRQTPLTLQAPIPPHWKSLGVSELSDRA